MSKKSSQLGRGRRRRPWGCLILLLLIIGGGAAGYHFREQLTKLYEERVNPWRPEKPKLGATHLVTRDDRVIPIRESGTVQAVKSIHIESEVEGQVRIISIIPEGTLVKKDDLLVELDSSQLQDKLRQQEISLASAQASLTETQEALEIQKEQSKSDITAVELKLEFAGIDLKKYVEGDWPQEKREAQAEITIAEEELKRARNKLKWTEKLEGEGFVTRSELEADALAVKKAELDLVRAREKLRILEKYAYPRKLKELESKVEEAKRELARVNHKARAQLLQKQADLRAKQATFALEEQKLTKIKDQIDKCRIAAPAPGLVVYFSGRWGRRWGASEIIQEGTMVRQRQKMITLPDVSAMRVEVSIHESAVDKVKPDQKVSITVDALPTRRFEAHVKSVAAIADSQSSWLNPDLKKYRTEVHIDSEPEGLKPGMSAKVEIVVAELKNVVNVPIQAVTEHQKRECCYVVVDDHLEMRVVKLGMADDKRVVVEEGLAPGERVLLYAPEPGHKIVKVGFDKPLPEPKEPARPTRPTPGEKGRRRGPDGTRRRGSGRPRKPE